MIVVILAALVVLAGPLAIRTMAPRTRSSSRPDWTAVSLVAAMLTVGLGTLGALAMLVWPLAARLGFVASYGHWSSGLVERFAPVPTAVSVIAACATILLLGRAVRVIAGEVRIVRASPAGPSGETLVVIEDPVPYAHAIHGWRVRPDRLVVSRGLLDLLDESERAAVLAHERSHLRSHHALLALGAAVAVALNPLLAEGRSEVDFSLERWADESAARATDRSTVAQAVGRTALAQMKSIRSSTPRARLAFDGSSVPPRVHALLTPPPDKHWRHAACYAAVIAVAAAVLLVGLVQSEEIIDVLQRAS